jgi:hypothetical protein
MFQELFGEEADDWQSVTTTAASSLSGISGNGKVSEHSARGKKRASNRESLATGELQQKKFKGGVERTYQDNPLGGNTYTRLHHTLDSVCLPAKQLQAFKKELKVLWRSINPTRPLPINVETFARAFQYCTVLHAKEVNRFGNSVARRSMLSAPRDGFHCTVQTDTLGSYCHILVLFDFCDQTYVYVQWLTPTYAGCTAKPKKHQVCTRSFKKLKITQTFAVIDIRQLVRAVAVVPVFNSKEFVWINTKAVGTALRALPELEKKSVSDFIEQGSTYLD